MPAPRPLAALVVLVAVLGACGGGDKKDETRVTTTGTAGPGEKQGGGISLKALLSGGEVAPGPGVKDGVGAFLIDVGARQGCYTLKVTMGEKPTMAHIHQGAKGASGPPVVDLAPSFAPGESAFEAKSCVDLPADTAAKLVGDPGAYYVNVHSEGHPDGAVRGQLVRY
jgi:hypothetical protein